LVRGEDLDVLTPADVQGMIKIVGGGFVSVGLVVSAATYISLM